jgi:DNA-binding protein H-NS
MGPYAELIQHFNRLKLEIESARLRETHRLLGELVELLDKNGVTLDDLIDYRSTLGGVRTRRNPKPKYFDPVTGQTWTGRGREPKWIRGKDRSGFLIDHTDEPT